MSNRLDEGFVKADSRNLPKLNMDMIYNFLREDDRFNAPEIRGVKAEKSGKEGYGDNAVGYVSVKREGDVCIIKAFICPEYKVRLNAYPVTLIINEKTHYIQEIDCSGCAAANEGCKHAFAFLMWVHRRCEEPSCTEVNCYWDKSALSSVGTQKKFMLISELLIASKKKTKLPDATTEIASTSKKTMNLPNGRLFLKDVVDQLKSDEADTQLPRYSSDLAYRDVYRLSLHQLAVSFSLEVERNPESFITFFKRKLDLNSCKKVEKETRQQSKSLLWHELRYGRITGSKLHEAAHCHTPEGSLVKRIIGVSKVYQSASMKRGTLLEPKVVEILQKEGYEIQSCGFIIIQSHPAFGASPDGVGKDFILKIKYPTTEETFKYYIDNGEITSKFEAQMLLQMFATGKKRAYSV